MTDSMKNLIQALRQRCLEKPGVRRDPLYDEDYKVLSGSLDGFARFILDETPPVVMLRCRDSVRRRLAKTSRNIRKSDRMYWKEEGWAWTDVGLDGSIPQETLLQLIDDSYQIVCDSLYDFGKLQLSLLRRNLKPRELLSELIAAYGLSRRREQIEALVRPSLLLKTAPAAESKLPLGRTKLGGRPDLPEGLEWPRFADGKPLAFLAQVNLAERPAEVKLTGLPRSGILYFFSVFGWQSEEGTDPQLPHGQYSPDWTRVLYHPGGDGPLRRLRTPTDVNAFKPAKVEFVPILSLPNDRREPAVAALGWKGSVKEKYDDLASSFRAARDHQLGNPARNLLLGFADYEQHFIDAVAEGGLQLLFQLASDQNAEMCWGDGGYIYFWVSPQDLRRRNFTRVYTDYQCG